MLRRKFLIRVGLLICAFVLGAAVAVWKLQDVQADLEQANADARILIDGVQTIGISVNELVGQQLRTQGIAGEADAGVASKATLAAVIAHLGTHPLLQSPGLAREQYLEMQRALAGLLSEHRPAGETADHTAEAGLRVHRLVQDLAASLRAYVAAEQVRVGEAFRYMVIGLTLAAFAMVNVSIYVLLRTAQLVLKPVAALVEGSRELAAENFAHRVDVARGDEFAELAHAYNSLGQQLQSNELRKTETLRQLAVTLNHDLNNTMSIIEMQLSLLDRRAGQDPSSAKPLREIRSGLVRMSKTVASLKDIRRIVLVEYAGGQKMIDLERSVAADAPEPKQLPMPAVPIAAGKGAM